MIVIDKNKIREEIQRKIDSYEALSKDNKCLFNDIKSIPESSGCQRRLDIIKNEIHIYGISKTTTPEKTGIDVWEKYFLFHYGITETSITPDHKIIDPGTGSIIRCFKIKAKIPNNIDINSAKKWNKYLSN